MVEPFVLPDESPWETAALRKRTLELKFFLVIMNCPNVSLEIIVISEGSSIQAIFLWAEKRIDMDVLEVHLKSFLRLEGSLRRAAWPLAGLWISVFAVAELIVKMLFQMSLKITRTMERSRGTATIMTSLSLTGSPSS